VRRLDMYLTSYYCYYYRPIFLVLLLLLLSVAAVAPEAFQKWGAQIPAENFFTVPPHFFVVPPPLQGTIGMCMAQ